MSRSLGDCVVHNSGVSAEPEIVVYRMNNNISNTGNYHEGSGGHNVHGQHQLVDEFIVLATDGIWDVLDNNTVLQLVVQNFINPAIQQQQHHHQGSGGTVSPFPTWSAADAANLLTKITRAKWEKLSPMIDDITCVVVKLI